VKIRQDKARVIRVLVLYIKLFHNLPEGLKEDRVHYLRAEVMGIIVIQKKNGLITFSTDIYQVS
jgi:hypothetical protein